MAHPLPVDIDQKQTYFFPRRCTVATLPVILAAVDGSNQSANTIAYLSRILSPENVRIELFHVLTEAPESVFDQGETEEIAAYGEEIGQWTSRRTMYIDRFMEAAKKTLVEAGFASENISYTIQTRRAGIARDILSRSHQGYSAVAIGRKGFGTLPEFMLGSIAAKLADTVTQAPLVIVGGQPETRKILVALDRSRIIRKGLDQVAPLLSRTLEEILLCHIVRPLSEPQPARESYFSSRNETHWLDESSRKIVPALVEAKQHMTRAGFEPKSFHTAIVKEKTSRADGLRGEAEALGIGTIIVGRRGTTSVDEFVMGRVTRKILYMAFNNAIWIV
jgi:nucleotide-binding universal stress UspA family protein